MTCSQPFVIDKKAILFPKNVTFLLMLPDHVKSPLKQEYLAAIRAVGITCNV